MLCVQPNHGWQLCFLLCTLASQFYPDYLEVATALVVPRGVGKASPHASIQCCIISNRGPLGILGFDRKQYTAKAIARGRENLLHFPLVLMNRLM